MPMCRRTYSFIPLVGLLGWSLAGGGDAAAGVAELPLMPGLDPARAAAVASGQAAGEVVAIATGQLDRRAVLDFYGAALPQLGWQRIAEARFQRERRILALGFSESAGALTVRFSIAQGQEPVS